MNDTMPDNAITGAELSNMMQGYQPLAMCHGDSPQGSVDMSRVVMEGTSGPSQTEPAPTPQQNTDNDIGSFVAKQNPTPFSFR